MTRSSKQSRRRRRPISDPLEIAVLCVMGFGCLLVALSFVEVFVTGRLSSTIVEAGTTMSLGGGLGSLGIKITDRDPEYRPPPEEIGRSRRRRSQSSASDGGSEKDDTS